MRTACALSSLQVQRASTREAAAAPGAVLDEGLGHPHRRSLVPASRARSGLPPEVATLPPSNTALKERSLEGELCFRTNGQEVNQHGSYGPTCEAEMA